MRCCSSVLVVMAFLGMSGLIPACVHVRQGREAMEDVLGIDIGIHNAGADRIDCTYVKFDGYCFRGGIVSPGSEKVHVSSGQSVPDKAEIGYQLPSKKEIVQTVSVKVHMPTNRIEDLVLHFNIDGEKPVTVEFFQFVQVEGKWRLIPCAPGPQAAGEGSK